LKTNINGINFFIKYYIISCNSRKSCDSLLSKITKKNEKQLTPGRRICAINNAVICRVTFMGKNQTIE
jgi:hypothetical protein